MQQNGRERLVRMHHFGTAVVNVSDPSRHCMWGNAFALVWIAHMLLFWQIHTWTLRPLACRNPPGLCVEPSRQLLPRDKCARCSTLARRSHLLYYSVYALLPRIMPLTKNKFILQWKTILSRTTFYSQPMTMHCHYYSGWF